MSKFIKLTLGVLCFCCLSFYTQTASASDVFSNDFSLSLEKSSQNYQLAKATFLPQYEYVDEPYQSHNQTYNDCPDKDALYTTTTCAYPRSVVPSSQCSMLPGYYKECVCLPQFKYACKEPKVPLKDTCDGLADKCVCPPSVELGENDECTQTCDGQCIAKSCKPLTSQSGCTNGTQLCDDGCGNFTRRCCVSCTHKVTTKPANSSFTYSSCTDGNGTTKIQTGWTCNSGYHQENGACVKNCSENSCSGYTLTTCPPNTQCLSCTKQTSACESGETYYKISACNSGYSLENGVCVESKPKCTENTCEGYNLTSCPENGSCETCTTKDADCNTGSTKYKLTSCAEGYIAMPVNNPTYCGKTLNVCAEYTLTTCPENGICSSCPTNKNLKKLDSCADGYRLFNNSCIAFSIDKPTNNRCLAINPPTMTCSDGRTYCCPEETQGCSDALAGKCYTQFDDGSFNAPTQIEDPFVADTPLADKIW